MGLIDPFALSESTVAVLSADRGVVLEVNPAFERAFGYPQEQVLGRTPLEIGLWPELAVRAAIWGGLREHRRISGLSVMARRVDGSTLPCRLCCELAVWQGQEVVFVLLDSAPERLASVADDPLRESYRSLYWHAAEGLYRSLPGAGLLDVNPALARIFGYESPTHMLLALGDDVSSLYADLEDARRVREEMAASGGLHARQLRMRRRDGQLIWISENARVVSDAQGAPLFYEGSVIDISDRCEAERALQESELLYRALVQNCRDGVFLIQRGRLVFVNTALAEMLGYTPAELNGRNYMDFVCAEDRAAQAARRQQREDGALDAQRYVIRLMHRDGRAVSCEVHADALSYQGDIASTGVMRDITVESRQRQALEEAEARYRELFQSSPVGLFRSTEAGRLIEVNPAMARMLRYPDARVMIATVQQVEKLYADPDDRERLLQALRGGGIVSDFVTRLLAGDGSLVWANLSVQRTGEDARGMELTGSIVDVSRQREAEHLLRFHANYDPLTGLPNRWQFEQQLLRMLGEAQANAAHNYAVLFLDLDGFKWVNDSLGHGAGDRLLVAIGERLSLQLGREAMLARYGGDEFSLLPHGECTRERALALAARISSLFQRAFSIDGHEVFSGASIGIVLGNAEYRWPEQLLRDADTAMYRAKAAGKAGFAVFDEAMHADARRRFELQTDLRQALDRHEFVVHYQPIVELDSGLALGCEALVRWQHPRRGLLLPSEFLELAEETGLIGELDLWVLRSACRQLAEWQALPGCSALSVNINMDERLVAAPTTPARVHEALVQAQLRASTLHIEVTERVFRSDFASTGERLAGLKATGAGLVVDDFGTGFSSLDSFAESPFDALKIDRGFIRDMSANPRHRAIVRTVVGFARDLGLVLTAEGVETEEQRAALVAMGCNRGQGFLFAPALPAAEFAQWLQRGVV